MAGTTMASWTTKLLQVTFEGDYSAGIERLATMLVDHYGSDLFPVVSVGLSVHSAGVVVSPSPCIADIPIGHVEHRRSRHHEPSRIGTTGKC